MYILTCSCFYRLTHVTAILSAAVELMYCRPLPKVRPEQNGIWVRDGDGDSVVNLDCFTYNKNRFVFCVKAWAEVRDNNNSSVDWMICSFLNGSKTDVTVISKGSGGVSACAAALPSGEPCYGGFKLKSGRFQHFYYVSDDTSVMKVRSQSHQVGSIDINRECPLYTLLPVPDQSLQ
jgi:hypothetical protein